MATSRPVALVVLLLCSGLVYVPHRFISSGEGYTTRNTLAGAAVGALVPWVLYSLWRLITGADRTATEAPARSAVEAALGAGMLAWRVENGALVLAPPDRTQISVPLLELHAHLTWKPQFLRGYSLIVELEGQKLSFGIGTSDLRALLSAVVKAFFSEPRTGTVTRHNSWDRVTSSHQLELTVKGGMLRIDGEQQAMARADVGALLRGEHHGVSGGTLVNFRADEEMRFWCRAYAEAACL